MNIYLKNFSLAKIIILIMSKVYRIWRFWNLNEFSFSMCCTLYDTQTIQRLDFDQILYMNNNKLRNKAENYVN